MQRAIDLIVKMRRRRPRLAVIDCKRPAAVEIVLARKRAIGGIDAVQSFQKRRHINGYGWKIDMPEMPGERLALKPAID